jgi:hypothetical protein
MAHADGDQQKIDIGTPEEVGRELKADDLKERQVVVIAPPGYNLICTMWVEHIDAQIVVFWSNILRWHVINFRKPDGTIVDDQNRPVKVFEYLGEV